MFRPVPQPISPRRASYGVSRQTVQRLLAERDALSRDRTVLVAEIQRLRAALAQCQSRSSDAQPHVHPIREPAPDAQDGVREQELLNDIAVLQRNVQSRVERAVVDERARVLSVVADTYDDVSRARGAAPSGEELQPVLDALDDRLNALGVSRVGRVGERFDPARFEAIALDDTQQHGTVVAVVASGLTGDDGGLLRPAKVVVGSAAQR